MKKYCIILLLFISFFMINPQEKLNEDTKKIILDPETAVSLALVNNLGIKI